MQEISSRVIAGFLLVAVLSITALVYYRFLWPVVLLVFLSKLAIMVRKQ